MSKPATLYAEICLKAGYKTFRNTLLHTLVFNTATNPTTNALASSLNPSTYGSSVTFTSTVSPSAASGTVTFKDGATPLGTSTLSGGVAKFTTNGLAIGAPSLTAEYSGDASYAASTSGVLTQTVNSAPPVITAQPQSTVAVGGLASLSVTATGTAPLAYQWFKDGVRLAGQNGSSLSFRSLRFTNSGCYSVVITNAAGLAISFPARLSVSNAPLRAWGDNDHGQLGNGNAISTNRPVSVVSNIVAVATGEQHSLLVKADGTLWAMGQNFMGQLGNGNNNSTNRPISVASNVVAVAAGLFHSLFLKADGSLWAMGYNTYGQLGNGTTSQTNLPVCVASNSQAVAAGLFHSLFAKTDGTLWTMGRNDYGQLGNGTSGTDVNSSLPVNVAANVAAVGAGQYHSLFVRGDGTLWTMGYNFHGELGNGRSGSTTSTNLPVQVSGLAAASLGSAGMATHSLAVSAASPQAASLTNQTKIVGQPLAFSVVVTNGDGPFTYQWQHSGTNLPGATSVTYSNASVQVSDAGTYAVAVTGPFGNAASFSASLTVLTPPIITTQPQSAVVAVGGAASLSVTNTGTAPCGYRWMKDGVLLVGQTGSSVNFASFQFTNSGSYSVVITNVGVWRSATRPA